jgi:hypothetical protein
MLPRQLVVLFVCSVVVLFLVNVLVASSLW